MYVAKYVDKKTGEVPPPEDYEMLKASGTLVNKVHPRYSDVEQGPMFTVEIKSSGNDEIKLELKSKP